MDLLYCIVISEIANLTVTKTYGGALMVTVAQNIFSNELIEGIQNNVPGVNPLDVINAGATNIESALSPGQLTEVLLLFMNALRDAFTLPIALTGIAFFIAFLLTKNMRIKGGIKLQGA